MIRSLLWILVLAHTASAHPFPSEITGVANVGADSYAVLDPTPVAAPANPTRVPLWQEDNLEPSATLLGPESRLDAAAPVTLLSTTAACDATAVAVRPYGLESSYAATVWWTASRLASTSCRPALFLLALAGRIPDAALEAEPRVELDTLARDEQAAIRSATGANEYVLEIRKLGSHRLHVTLNRRGKVQGRTLVLDGKRVVARFDGIASWTISSRGQLAFYGTKGSAGSTLLGVVP